MVPVNGETRAIALGLGLMALYSALVLLTGLVPLDIYARLFAAYLDITFPIWLLIGLVAALVMILRKGRETKFEDSAFAYLATVARDRWRRDRWVSAIWPPLLFAWLMSTFNLFKQLVLVGAAFRFDSLFAGLDRALFLGHDPWTVTHALLASPTATLVIDQLYHGWFLPMSLGVMICAWLPASTHRLRTQYLLTYIGVWVLQGSLLAYLLPAAGPCFVVPLVDAQSGFRELVALLQSQQAALGDTQIVALANQKMLLASYGSSEVAIGGGISAMPSVHNGLAILFAIAAFRIKPWLGWIVSAYAFAIWIGSIHLGWHYAIDGIAAAALTVLTWRVAGAAAAWLDRPATGGQTEDLSPALGTSIAG